MSTKNNKVLYIDNISSYDYIKNYKENHSKADDKKTSYFTYVVFTEYERPNNYGVSYFGDIFFNGTKMTYINDVNTNTVVSDGMTNIIGYVGGPGAGISFATSSIIIDNISNKYELFNVDSAEVSYNYVSNIGKYTIEKPGKWSYIVKNDGNGNVKVENSSIICSNVTGTVDVHISYSFEIGNNKIGKKSCVSYAYFNIYNAANVSKVTFGYTPSYMTYGMIYTPMMDIEPFGADNVVSYFESSNTSCIEITNIYTGTMICKKPGKSIITCSYNYDYKTEQYTSQVTYEITVLKINPHISLSAYNTTYLYNDDPYKSTYCTAHYDTLNIDNTITWYPKNINNNNLGNSYTTNDIRYDYLTPSGIHKLTAKLNESYFYPCQATIQLYAPGQNYGKTTSINITNYVENEHGTASFVIVAKGSTGLVNTNYSFANSLGFTNFTITDITFDSTNNITYTYVTASLDPNTVNNEYINNYTGSSSNVTLSNFINVQTTDNSLLRYSYPINYNVTIDHNKIIGKENNIANTTSFNAIELEEL